MKFVNNKNKLVFIIGIFGLLTLSIFLNNCISTFNVIQRIDLDHNPSLKITDSPIEIWGNDELGSEADSGSGSENDPWIIADRTIYGTGNDLGVWIENTDEYFILRNIIFYGIDRETGILIRNVNNGRFENNQIYGGGDGIMIEDSHFNTFANNIVEDTTHHGFILQYSHNNTFLDNNLYNNPLGYRVEFDCHNNTFIGNIVSHSEYFGFFLEDAYHNILINNTAVNNQKGFELRDNAYYNVLFNNIGSNNLLDGFGLDWDARYNTLINNTASNNQQNGFVIPRDTDLVNNTASNNQQNGFVISVSSYTIANNIAFQNNVGFHIGGSRNNFSGNIALNNNIYGFRVTSNANNNEFYNNTMRENGIIGLLADGNSENNTFKFNIIINNPLFDAQDNSSKINIWSSNTYGNYSGQGIYHIPGSAGAIDSSPIPLDTDLDGMPNWFEQLFNFDIYTNDSFLDFDNDGLTNFREYILGTNPIVYTYASPVITHTTINDSIIWIAVGQKATIFTIYENSSLVQTGNWISGKNISYFIGDLSPGVYNFTLVVKNELGSLTSHSLTITIPDPPIAETTTVTVPNTTTKTEFVTSTNTEITTSTTLETSFTTSISQIVETITKTTEGFGVVFIAISILGLIIIRRRRRQ